MGRIFNTKILSSLQCFVTGLLISGMVFFFSWFHSFCLVQRSVSYLRPCSVTVIFTRFCLQKYHPRFSVHVDIICIFRPCPICVYNPFCIHFHASVNLNICYLFIFNVTTVSTLYFELFKHSAKDRGSFQFVWVL